jgi:hypothetical protein
VWIKPSFLWMMYRCGWATKPLQERVLAVEITRTGFEWALAHSCLSHFDADLIRAGDDRAATALLPVERPYPLPAAVAERIGADAPPRA